MQHLELLVTLICFVAIKEVMNNFGNPCLIRIMMNLYKKKGKMMNRTKIVSR